MGAFFLLFSACLAWCVVADQGPLLIGKRWQNRNLLLAANFFKDKLKSSRCGTGNLPHGLTGFQPYRRPVSGTSQRAAMFTSSGPDCACNAVYNYHDLGRGYFPRFLSAAHCEPNSCWNKTHVCQEKPHIVKVLRKRNVGQPIDEFIPEALRGDWMFEDVAVNLTCQCVI